MRSTTILMAIGLAIGGYSLHAQKFKITSFSTLGGLHLADSPNLNLQDIRTLAPESSLLKDDLNDYAHDNYYSTYANGSVSFLIGLNKYRDNGELSPVEWRLGITYRAGSALTKDYWKEDKYPYDTLVSTRNGSTYLIDSVHNTGYSFSYNREVIMADVAFLYRYYTPGRWTLHTGIGLAGGMTINSQSTIYHYEHNYLSNVDNNSYFNAGFEDRRYDDKVETFDNKNGWVATAYIPLGADFQLGRKSEFWRHIHLFAELRPSFNLESIPDLKTLTHVSVFHGWGIRII